MTCNLGAGGQSHKGRCELAYGESRQLRAAIFAPRLAIMKMARIIPLLLCLPIAAACTDTPRLGGLFKKPAPEIGGAPVEGALSDAAVPEAGAITVEALDTTSEAERAAVSVESPPVAGEQSLGTVVASLGSPTEPGFWLKTPLVKTRMTGRVLYSANGKSVLVDLIPVEGAGATQISLPAMRLLEAPLGVLIELQVFAG